MADKTAPTTADPATLSIFVESDVGIAVTTGASLYTASAGEVAVPINSAGKCPFDTVGTLVALKTVDALGAVVGSPATMALLVRDTY